MKLIIRGIPFFIFLISTCLFLFIPNWGLANFIFGILVSILALFFSLLHEYTSTKTRQIPWLILLALSIAWFFVDPGFEPLLGLLGTIAIYYENSGDVTRKLDQDTDSVWKKRFAIHIERELVYLNNQEDWRDYQFAELEAEVEAENQPLKFGNFRVPFTLKKQKRKYESLSLALAQSSERLILLEGSPGSGKSVALRHVGLGIASNAQTSKPKTNLIPLYINLKELRRESSQQVNANLIRSFIIQFLNRVNNRDVEEFLDREFDRGTRNGNWIFLFDSFDEIPEVLSSTEVDQIVRIYAEAIRDFMHGMNNCRGILASREYKGPSYLGWTKFSILPLSRQKRIQLINRYGLSAKQQNELISKIDSSSPDYQLMMKNPMFLAILCEYLRSQSEFKLPQQSFSVFDLYIEQRLRRDSERLYRKYNKMPSEIRLAAEKLAFCMTIESQTGLAPTLSELKNIIIRHNLDLEEFDLFVDGLEYLKLAKPNISALDGQTLFTFSHRRYQEFFATSFILKRPHLLSPRLLLTDGRWRETVVVLLQTQAIISTMHIVDEAFNILSEQTQKIQLPNVDIDTMNESKELIDNPNIVLKLRNILRTLAQEFLDAVQKMLREPFSDDKEKVLSYIHSQSIHHAEPFVWPKGLLNLLGIMQDGLSERGSELLNKIQTHVISLITQVFNQGTILDKKWALEVVGTINLNSRIPFLQKGFESRSNYLVDIAYQQTARFRSIPKDLASFIHKRIISVALNNQLLGGRHEMKAFLSRLENSREYFYTYYLMLSLPFIDAILVVVGLGTYFRGRLSIPIVFLLSIFIIGITWMRRANNFTSDASLLLITRNVLPRLLFLIAIPFAFPQLAAEASLADMKSIILIFSLFWSSSAAFIAQYSGFSHPMFWLLYPIGTVFGAIAMATIGMSLSIPLIVLLFAVFIVRAIRNEFQKSTWRGLQSLSRAGTIIIIFSVITAWVISIINKIPRQAIWISIAILIGIFLIGISPELYKAYIRYQKEKQFYGIWVLNKSKINSLKDLLQVLTKFSSSRFRSQVFQTIRENQLLVPLPTLESELMLFIAFLENVSEIFFQFRTATDSMVAREYLAEIVLIEEINKLPKQPIMLMAEVLEKNPNELKIRDILNVFSYDDIDEYCRLLEQISTSK